MNKLLQLLCLTISIASFSAMADTPQQFLAGYESQARTEPSGFKAFSAESGKAFFQLRRSNNADMPACTSCHTLNPAGEGKHVVTDKRIRPLAPAANPDRFTDPAKVEKWFGRNCKDVVGRPCSAQEKGDVLTYLITVK